MARVSRLAIWTIYFVVFVDLFQVSFVFPLLPQVVEGFGKGASEIGLLGSVAAAGEGLAAPYLGSLADRIGRRPVFILALLGSIASSVVIGFADSYYFLLVARLIGGVCGGTGGIAAAYIADVTTQEERADYMTYFQAAIFLGLSVGPAVGGFIDHLAGYKAACFSAAGICVLNLLCVIFFVKDSRTAEARAALTQSADAAGGQDEAAAAARVRPPRLPCAAWVIGVASLLNAVGFTAFEALGVMYVQDEFFAGDAGRATLFWSKTISGVGVVGLIVNLLLYSRIQKRTGLKGAILLGGLCSTASFFAIGFPISPWWFFGWVQVLVFGENIMGTSVQTIITFVVDPSQFGKAIGMMTFFGNIARAFGPFIYGPVYEHVSKTMPWWSNSVLKLMAVLLCVAVRTKAQEQASPEAPPASPSDPEEAVARSLSRQTTGAFKAPGASLSLALAVDADRSQSARELARSQTWNWGQKAAQQAPTARGPATRAVTADPSAMA